MSDKPHNQLNPLDLAIRRAVSTGMFDGVHLTIEFFSGFEEFNTRPYHNYETWSNGYRVGGKGIVVEREDLDDAIAAWIREWDKVEDKQALKEGSPSKFQKWDKEGRKLFK